MFVGTTVFEVPPLTALFLAEPTWTLMQWTISSHAFLLFGCCCFITSSMLLFEHNTGVPLVWCPSERWFWPPFCFLLGSLFFTALAVASMLTFRLAKIKASMAVLGSLCYLVGSYTMLLI